MRAQVIAAAERRHATAVRVFGSAGTSSDTIDSDLDLLVHFTDEATLYDQVGLTEELEHLLGIKVDVISDGAPGAERIRNAVLL